MKEGTRWVRAGRNYNPVGFIETPREDAFLRDLTEVCRKHGMSLGHEDGHGSFIVEVPLSEETIDWMNSANVYREESVQSKIVEEKR